MVIDRNDIAAKALIDSVEKQPNPETNLPRGEIKPLENRDFSGLFNCCAVGDNSQIAELVLDNPMKLGG